MTTNEGRRGGRPRTQRVAYGFLAFDSVNAMCGADGPWRMAAQRCFRVQYIVAWAVGSAEIGQILMAGENQLMLEPGQRVPVKAAFEPAISPAYVATRFFDPPLEEGGGRAVLIAKPVVPRFEVDLGSVHGFRTLPVGEEASVQFFGYLQGLLLIGEELI